MKPSHISLFIVITLAFTAALQNYASAQAFKAEIIGGFNKSQVDGDETAGFKKYGLNTGLGVVLPVYKNWSLSLETLYNQKGSRLRKQFNDSLDGSYKLVMNYAEVPFMIQYTDRDFMTFSAGVSWGRLVHVEEWKNGYRVDSVTLLNGPFSRDNFDAFGDVRFRIYQNFKINLRYSYSLKKLATRTVRDSMSGVMNERDFYHNLWSLRLIYVLNESRKSIRTPNATQPK
jgi:hypothetical protein